MMQSNRWCVRQFPFDGTGWSDLTVPAGMSMGANKLILNSTADVLYGDDSDPTYQIGLRGGVEKALGDATFAPGQTVPGGPDAFQWGRFGAGTCVCRIKAANPGNGVLTVEFLR